MTFTLVSERSRAVSQAKGEEGILAKGSHVRGPVWGETHCVLFKERRERHCAVPLGAGSRTWKRNVEHSMRRLDREGPHHGGSCRPCKHLHAIFITLGSQWKVLAGM